MASFDELFASTLEILNTFSTTNANSDKFSEFKHGVTKVASEKTPLEEHCDGLLDKICFYTYYITDCFLPLYNILDEFNKEIRSQKCTVGKMNIYEAKSLENIDKQLHFSSSIVVIPVKNLFNIYTRKARALSSTQEKIDFLACFFYDFTSTMKRVMRTSGKSFNSIIASEFESELKTLSTFPLNKAKECINSYLEALGTLGEKVQKISLSQEAKLTDDDLNYKLTSFIIFTEQLSNNVKHYGDRIKDTKNTVSNIKAGVAQWFINCFILYLIFKNNKSSYIKNYIRYSVTHVISKGDITVQDIGKFTTESINNNYPLYNTKLPFRATDKGNDALNFGNYLKFVSNALTGSDFKGSMFKSPIFKDFLDNIVMTDFSTVKGTIVDSSRKMPGYTTWKTRKTK